MYKFSIVSLIVCILAVITGCVNTQQLSNEASIYYSESQNFADSRLDSNRVNGVLILVSTGYVQVRNERQLSIYFKCYTSQQKNVALVSSEFLIPHKPKLIAESVGIDCTENASDPSAGTGYAHFFEDKISKYISSGESNLSLKLEVDGESYQLTLPLKAKTVSVWPT